MKKYYYTLLVFLTLSCSSTKNKNVEIKETQKNISVQKQRITSTYSKDLPYPFLHINGFKNFELRDYNLKLDRKKLTVKELRFNATYSSFYTKKVMFDNFGDWDQAIRVRGSRHPLLMWKNIKLNKNQDKEYIIIARSFEDTRSSISKLKRSGEKFSIYTSVMVLDSELNDCFSNPKDRQLIINYFSKGIKNLTNSELFYNKYWNMVQRKDF